MARLAESSLILTLSQEVSQSPPLRAFLFSSACLFRLMPPNPASWGLFGVSAWQCPRRESLHGSLSGEVSRQCRRLTSFVWGPRADMKAVSGFFPHFPRQAEKG